MEKCLSLAQRAVRTDRDDYRVITWASYNFLQCGQPIATVNALIGQALEMNPGDSVTHFLSGWINVFAPNPMKALAAFETGLRLDPRSPWRVVFFAGQGIALFHLDRFEEAIPLLREAAEYSPSASSVFNTMQAAAYGFLGKTAQAQALDGVCYPLSARDEVYLDQVRDGSLKPKLLEGLRLAGIGVD